MLRAEIRYWKGCHQMTLEGEALLKQKIEELKAKARLRERQLFGRRSEKGSQGQGHLAQDKDPENKLKRGPTENEITR